MIKEKVLAFYNEYQAKVSDINKKIAAAAQRVNDSNLQIKFIREKELPSAIEKRVLESDLGLENKLRKTLAKLEKEYQEANEELLVLQNVLQKYKLESADKVAELQNLFRDERKLQEQSAYSKMMYHKKKYVDAILQESEAIQEYQDVDVKLQEVLLAGGRINSIYNVLEVDTAPLKSHLNRHNGIYLQFELDDVKRLVKGTVKPEELAYLNKFSNKKDM
jgi:hypothetical protein